MTIGKTSPAAPPSTSRSRTANDGDAVAAPVAGEPDQRGRAPLPPLNIVVAIDDDARDSATWAALGDVEATIATATDEVGSALADGRVGDRVATPKRGRSPRASLQAEMTVTSDARMRAINATHRGQDKPTNVLSFPVPRLPAAPPGTAQPIGDIVLAAETIVREAGELGISPAHHLAHLVIHGLLHLLGYDHDADADGEAMEAAETALLASIDIADPYCDSEPDSARADADCRAQRP